MAAVCVVRAGPSSGPALAQVGGFERDVGSDARALLDPDQVPTAAHRGRLDPPRRVQLDLCVQPFERDLGPRVRDEGEWERGELVEVAVDQQGAKTKRQAMVSAATRALYSTPIKSRPPPTVADWVHPGWLVDERDDVKTDRSEGARSLTKRQSTRV
jgi:hypothetical protein